MMGLRRDHGTKSGGDTVRPARYRLRHMQEFVERDGALRNGMTGATAERELRVVVKDIDDEKRLLRGTP